MRKKMIIICIIILMILIIGMIYLANIRNGENNDKDIEVLNSGESRIITRKELKITEDDVFEYKRTIKEVGEDTKISGIDRLDDFIENCEFNISDVIRIIHYSEDDEQIIDEIRYNAEENYVELTTGEFTTKYDNFQVLRVYNDQGLYSLVLKSNSEENVVSIPVFEYFYIPLGQPYIGSININEMSKAFYSIDNLKIDYKTEYIDLEKLEEYKTIYELKSILQTAIAYNYKEKSGDTYNKLGEFSLSYITENNKKFSITLSKEKCMQSQIILDTQKDYNKSHLYSSAIDNIVDIAIFKNDDEYYAVFDLANNNFCIKGYKMTKNEFVKIIKYIIDTDVFVNNPIIF